MLASLLCIVVFTSVLGGVVATDYVGVAVDDVFVWELTDGEITMYAKYEITAVTELLGFETITATYTVYDVENDELTVLEDSPFVYYYTEDLLNVLSLLGTGVTNETKTYGEESRDCYVISSLTGYTGEITIDAATGLFLEMAIAGSGSFKLVAWEDQDLEAEYGTAGGIPGYGLGIFGICAVIPIGYILRKYRK